MFPVERGCAAARWPFHSRTRGLRPAYSAEPESASYGGSAPTPLHLQAPAAQLPAASPPAGPDLSLKSARRARSTRLRGADRRVTHSEAPPQWPRSPVTLRTPSAATAGSSPKLIARPRPLPALWSYVTSCRTYTYRGAPFQDCWRRGARAARASAAFKRKGAKAAGVGRAPAIG